MDQTTEVRLFLSVDIAGSTALKNRQNYSSLVKADAGKKRLLATVKERLLASKAALSPAALDEIVEDVLLAHLPSEEDLDWAAMLQRCFSDFHTYFQRRLTTNEDLTIPPAAVDQHDTFPWKALGDELIYSFRVQSRQDIQTLLTHFLASLREYDRKLSVHDRIRLKSSAWIAGFPIRNRKVELPMANLKLDGQASDAAEYPYPRIDYLGPDMDTGFRLGKWTWPSLCVVSVELAQLLGECQTTSQIRLRQVGWQKMKGVWEDKPYPILWAELPPEHPQSKPYREIKTWAKGESDLVLKWTQENPREAKDFLRLIEELRNQLPPELGIVKPYICAEGDDIDPSHESIRTLLREQGRGIGGKQTTANSAALQDPTAPDSAVVERLVDEKLKAIESVVSPEQDGTGTKAIE